MFDQAMKRACERYRAAGRFAYHYTQGKLGRDPAYRAVLEANLIPSEGTLLDLGCGRGLLLALLVEVRELGGAAPRLIGVEMREGAAAIARLALAGAAEIITADVRDRPLPSARVIVLFDVLSMMPERDQETLLDVLIRTLEPGGTLLVREADAAAGWRFQTVEVVNRLKAWALGTRHVRFHFRTQAQWQAWLEAAGLKVEARPMGQGTPFGNVLLVGRKAG